MSYDRMESINTHTEKINSIDAPTLPAISIAGRATIDLDDQIYILTEHVSKLYDAFSSVYRPSDLLAERKPLYGDEVTSDFTKGQRQRVEKIAGVNASILHLIENSEL